VRVVTLLPAATEIVAAVGGADRLVGISHECDCPPWVHRLPRITTSPVDPDAPGVMIDAEVRRLRGAGRPVIGIDGEQLQRLRPDLIITQGLCEVCAVSDGQVAGVASETRVLSLTARDLSGIWEDIRSVGAALDLAEDAEELVLGLRSRLGRLRREPSSVRRRVLCVEWLEPLYLAGHWVPEMVEAGGGSDVAAQPGTHSTRHEWRDLYGHDADCILVMLCGFTAERARHELDALEDPEALTLLSRVPTWIIDGNSYTSRPGPRVVDGAGLIRSAISGQPQTGIERWWPR
jgi:iron complex transport system substrate-binding protein